MDGEELCYDVYLLDKGPPNGFSSDPKSLLPRPSFHPSAFFQQQKRLGDQKVQARFSVLHQNPKRLTEE